MDGSVSVQDLKRQLLGEVRLLFHRNGSAWKEPILKVLEDLRQSNVQAVLFGGTLRSLLVSRLFQGKFGRPRDVDVVISGAPLSALEERFSDIIARRTRFGGLQLRRGEWHFDVWPVSETWAFRQDRSRLATFAELPSTTTFNLEAVAVEAWSREGRARALFSGDDQFFDGILSRTLELNRDDSPFPELTVVRAVIIASGLGFRIGPRLATYIRDIGSSLTEDVLAEVQMRHYGHARMQSGTLKELLEVVARRASDREPCELPTIGQLQLWQPTREASIPRLNVRFAGS